MWLIYQYFLDCFGDTRAIIWLPHDKWNYPEKYGQIQSIPYSIMLDCSFGHIVEDIRAGMNNYIPLFCVDVIVYPCHTHADLAIC